MRRYKSGMRGAPWRWTDVVLGGKLYLRRMHLVQTPCFSLMLHWIPCPDPQPDMHDHPVSFTSWMIRGGCAEETPERHTHVAALEHAPHACHTPTPHYHLAA